MSSPQIDGLAYRVLLEAVLVPPIPEVPILDTPYVNLETFVDEPFSVDLSVNWTDPLGPGTTYACYEPPGLTLDVNTGILSGTPTSLGSNFMEVEATNADGTATAPSFSLVIAAIPVELPVLDTPYVALQNETDELITPVDLSVNWSLADTYTQVALPIGLVLDTNTGIVTGTTDSVPIIKAVVITAHNADGSTDAPSFNWTLVTPPPSEFVINGTFDTDVSGWDNAGFVWNAAGTCEVDLAAFGQAPRQTTGAPTNILLELSFDSWLGTTTQTGLNISINAMGDMAGQLLSPTLTATPQSASVQFTLTGFDVATIIIGANWGSPGTYFIDNISIKPV